MVETSQDRVFDRGKIFCLRRMAGLVKPQCGTGDCHECLLWAVLKCTNQGRIKNAALALMAARALGIDCCQAFLDQAWHRAELGWVPNVKFKCCDIETARPEGAFDFAFARFGTQFFANPVTGLRSIRQCLKQNGGLAQMVWRIRADNAWLTRSRDVVQTILPLPGEDARTCGPGPFSMADEATTRAQMEAAGYVDICFQRIDTKVLVGQSVEEAIAFQLAIGPAGETFREAGELGIARKKEVDAALSEMFAEVEQDEQWLWMDSSPWLITARNPTDEGITDIT